MSTREPFWTWSSVQTGCPGMQQRDATITTTLNPFSKDVVLCGIEICYDLTYDVATRWPSCT